MKSWYRNLSVVFGLAVSMMLCAPAALAQSGYTYSTSVGQTVSTACSSGEAVALSGTLQFQYSVTQDPDSGNYRFQIAIMSSLSGVGQTTQTNYAENDTYGYGVTSASSPIQVTLQLQPTLVSQSSAPNLVLPQTVNITADTSGNITVSVANGSTSCGS